MKISVIEPGARFRVDSDSGKMYEITYAGSGDADPEYVALWTCNCPARRECKHLRAFFNSRLMDVGDGDDDDQERRQP